MTQKKPNTVYLKDYRPPAYLVETIDLTFDLYDSHCLVKSTLHSTLNSSQANPGTPFVCDGENLELLSLRLNKQAIPDRRVQIDSEAMTIYDVPNEFDLEIETKIYPQQNKALEGLYQSGNILCTQCEAEGFRRITYYPDKPDILAKYSTKIIADQKQFPVLLSNGNPVAKGSLENGRHWVSWVDPFKKPSYLFALVAGDLVAIEDNFITCSGRKVTLRIYVEKENAEKCDHAMQSLKKSMRWDEVTFGREYDLDIFMIVAVNHFNAGAMENKGLNIFNSSLVLAKPATATDSDYERIQGVVAHEYFHNWTGNRITCRDWFQLSLKEGLTIYRDQEFSAEMTSRAAKRIADVNFLRTNQFSEDAGPMAHQVRPESYIEINNFYTVTVYHKGAELIRMMSILLGKQGFFKGMDLYFSRHDGQAVTIEDFIKAMEDANQVDFTQFRLWYSQAGTPEVSMTCLYNPTAQTFQVGFSQSCPSTPGQAHKEPFIIPIVMGLLGADGRPLGLSLQGSDRSTPVETITLELKERQQTFVFTGVPVKPVPSVFRNFSAPVKLRHNLSVEELLFLMSHDSDAFNRWEAAQHLLTMTILDLIEEKQQKSLTPSDLVPIVTDRTLGIVKAFRQTLADMELENEIKCQTMTLPGEHYLSEQMAVIDIEAIHTVYETVKQSLAQALKTELLATYHSLNKRDKAGYDPESAGIRSLKNLALEYLMTLEDSEIYELCQNQFAQARTMTDEMKALTFIVNQNLAERNRVLKEFYVKWQHDSVVMNIWLSIQATSKLTTVSDIKRLLQHPVFEIQNPNRVRALVGAFVTSNLINFHQITGEGYELLTELVLVLNKINPQVASRLLNPLARWRKFEPKRQGLIKQHLEKILQNPDISKDVYEITSKYLA